MTPVIHYICSKCHFQFTRISAPEGCPNCGSANVREEAERLEEARQEERLGIN